MATQITRDDDQHRYEIRVDGELAGFTEFRPDGGTLVFPHTEIGARFGGRGLAKQLIGAALDDVRSRGEKIVPRCEFVRAFVEKNPDYADLVG